MNIAAGTNTGGRVIPPNRLDVYYLIRNIFPNINAEHIKDMILNPDLYGITNSENNEHFVTSLTEYLLVNGDEHLDLGNVGAVDHYRHEIVPDYEYQANSLISIFPDADPDFLMKFARDNFMDPEKISTFIEENLNNKNYPTRDDYAKRKKIERDFTKYFESFSVKDFLKEIPNPGDYFENMKRNCEDNHATRSLLYELFNTLDKVLINKEYTSCNYNATLTAKNLQENYSGIIPKPFTKDCLKFLENKMQEFSFICNRKIIENEIEKEKLVEELSIKCESCFDFVAETKCSACENGHIFCNPCIFEGTKVKFGEGIYHILCFAKCESFFSQKTLQNVLDSKMFEILMKKNRELSIAAAAIKNLESCPFCDFMMQINEDSQIFFCMNEDCRKQSCRRCKKINHLPNDCADVLELQSARLYIEEKMTRAVLRKCLQCERPFLKSDGCNRMNCPCGNVQCYLCDKQVSATDYKHFNGQGSDRHDLCPLYSDDKYQEVESVREVARITRAEILKKNPDFNTEVVDALLPSLPKRAEGPHEQIPNSNQLPEHVLKVAKAISP